MFRTFLRVPARAFAAGLLPVLLLALAVPASAAPVPLRASELGDSHSIEVIAAGPERTVLRFRVGDFRLLPVTIDGQAWSILDWEGGENRLDLGAPAVPGFRESIVIPNEGAMRITVLAEEHRDFANVRLAPSKGPITRDVLPQDVPWTFDADVYGRDAFWPADLAEIGDPYILREVRGAVVGMNAFRWNPVTETLRVTTSVTVEVTVADPVGPNPLVPRPQLARTDEFERIYERHFLNWSRLDRYVPVGEVGPMLVVSHDSFLATVQPLVDWKNQMGVPTTLVPMSAIGSTASALKAYVQNVFDTEGLCFILLVGDAAQIPYFTNGGGAADPMLTLLAGSDSYPDAFVGRLSGNNVGEIQTQVERIIEYERDPDPAGLWYSRGIAIASNEGAGIGDDGEPDWQHARNYRADLLGFTYTTVDELYDGTHPADGGTGSTPSGDQPGDPTSANVVSLLNQGRSLVHYTGHGSTWDWVTTGFDINDINGLVNDNMLPHVVSVGCVNGAFMSGTCFAEAWMRATHAGEPTGAVAIYASTVNQQWATPMRAQDEMVDLLCAEDKCTVGGLCFNGSCDMIDHYGSNGITEFKNWTMFGDPSVILRSATPAALAVTHGGFVDASAGSFVVQTEPGALAALSDAGLLLGSAYADGGGVAIITFDPADFSGRTEVTLTVTAFNGLPSIEQLGVQSGSTAVAESGAASLGSFPNPFASSTRISLALTREQSVSLEIFDVTGRRVRALHAGPLAAGTHRLEWDGTTDAGIPVAAGTYFYRLATDTRTETRRVVRLR